MFRAEETHGQELCDEVLAGFLCKNLVLNNTDTSRSVPLDPRARDHYLALFCLAVQDYCTILRERKRRDQNTGKTATQCGSSHWSWQGEVSISQWVAVSDSP